MAVIEKNQQSDLDRIKALAQKQFSRMQSQLGGECLRGLQKKELSFKACYASPAYALDDSGFGAFARDLLSRVPLRQKEGSPAKTPRRMPAGSRLYANIPAYPLYYLATANLTTAEQHSEKMGRDIVGKDMLEIGPGDGVLTHKTFEKTGYPASYVCMDVSAENILSTFFQLCVVGELPPEKFSFVLGDAFDPATYDCAAITVLQERSKGTVTVRIAGGTLGNNMVKEEGEPARRVISMDKILIMVDAVQHYVGPHITYQIDTDNTRHIPTLRDAYDNKWVDLFMQSGMLSHIRSVHAQPPERDSFKLKTEIGERGVEVYLRSLRDQSFHLYHTDFILTQRELFAFEKGEDILCTESDKLERGLYRNLFDKMKGEVGDCLRPSLDNKYVENPTWVLKCDRS
ncbi:MAG: L-histidine N(alpha)-methyltransferase [Alphaproteobacteria bacterium]|nr:L-histidine N(alpha)-methyltransferase [Alphaproteobacteria bacterium]